MLKKVSLILFLLLSLVPAAHSQDALRICYAANGKIYSTLEEAQGDLRSYCDSTMPQSYPGDGYNEILMGVQWGEFWGMNALEYKYYNSNYPGKVNVISICAFVAVQYGDMCPNSTPTTDPTDATQDDTILEDLTIKDDGLTIELANNDPLVVDGLPLNTECDTQCSAGDPVNVSSGFMWHMITDFSLKGRTKKIGLDFNRVYVAHPVLSSKALGSHWFHNFQTNIAPYRVNKKDNLMWTDEKGGVYIFLKNSDGTYKSPVGFNALLTEYNDRYEIIKPNKVKLTFTKDTTVAPVGSLVSISEPHGEKVLLNYANGLLVSAETGLAGKITFSYDQNNHLIEVHRVRDNLSHKYAYDDLGNLISATDFAGLKTTYQYQQSDEPYLDKLLISFTDPIGRTFSFQYDDSGRVVTETEPGNAKRYFQYYFNENGERVTKLQEISGSVVYYVSDSKYHLMRKVHPNGGISYNSWNNQNKILSTTDALGYVIKYDYDKNGNVISVLKAANTHPTLIDYDENFNVPAQITPPVGAVTAFTIDQTNGDVLQVTKGNLSLKYSYDLFGNILSTDNGKKIYSNNTNGNGQLTSIYDSRNSQSLNYDSRARIISRKFKSGRMLSYSYDDYDRIVRIDDSSGPSIINVYDKMGRLISRTLSGRKLSETTTYGWDVRDRLILVKDALGRITKYQYDNGEQVIDKPTAIITPDGKVTKLEYDQMLQIVKKTDPKRQVTRFTYDLVGNLTSVIDAKNQVTNFQYDGNRRVIYSNEPTVITDSSGKSLEVRLAKTFFYNEADQLIKKIVKINNRLAKLFVTRFTYDSLGRMAKRVHQKIGLNNAIEVQEGAEFAYSPQLDANLVTYAKNGKEILNFGYEAVPPFKNVSFSVHAADFSKSSELLEGDFIIDRDYSGEIASIKNIQGASLLNSIYDPAGRLLKISSGNFLGQKTLPFSSSLNYDDLGRKIGVSNSDGFEQSISYDQLNRINSLRWTRKTGAYLDHDHDDIYQNVSEKLTYDLAGNIIESQREHGRSFFTYDDIGQLIAEGHDKHSRSYQYDAVGNRIFDSREGSSEYIANAIISNKDSVFGYDVDGHGHLTSEYDKKNKTRKDFSYYLSGRLAKFQIASEKNAKELDVAYGYDSFGRRVQKNFTFTKEHKLENFNHAFLYLADEDKILLGRNGKGEITLYIDGLGIDEHLGEVSKDGAKSYITDHLGSVLNTEATSGRKMFGAFGDSFKENLPLSEKEKFASPVVYGFAGRQLDLESGLYYNRARMYDANNGRFTTKDPIGLKGGDINMYRFVENNPLSFVDSEGFAALPPDIGASPLETHQGVQMLVNSYMNTSNQNVQSAWETAVSERISGVATGNAAASAEHYLYARLEVSNGDTSPLLMGVQTVGYQVAKEVGQTTKTGFQDSTPGSLLQLISGLEGIGDGLCK